MTVCAIRHEVDGYGRKSTSMWFCCPGCDDVHQIPIKAEAGITWDFDPATVTVSPSIACDYGPLGYGGQPRRCHSFIRSGRIEYLTDCTHALAGQTVELPPIPDGHWLMQDDTKEDPNVR